MALLKGDEKNGINISEENLVSPQEEALSIETVG